MIIPSRVNSMPPVVPKCSGMAGRRNLLATETCHDGRESAAHKGFAIKTPAQEVSNPAGQCG